MEQRQKIAANIAADLGPPPERKRRAGRLNPAGVIGFYGAFDLETCVAELRPAVGAIVVAAEFAITEPICVLDTTLFEAKAKEADLYAKNAQARAAQWNFMQSFMLEIAQPISPGDEHLDYLPTQAVAEYLNKHHRFSFAGQGAHDRRDHLPVGPAPGRQEHRPAGRGCARGLRTRRGPGARRRVDDWPSLTFSSPTKPKVRIVPVADSLVKHKVSGASFPTQPYLDAGDYDPHDVDQDY
ncbi:RES family NAD+ phosphorylase [Phenylobacterium sp. J367]|uniref:RES family NAD+ phosphorylase n=1 Tax=Phenylobacterium sp. J367 TaxID=2898435 RepID=UPI002151D4D7|nr:RES family NAD+ phosphorylase [Phenylobacterium sp. J367]MCR5881216.1 RES family NAD+ phosphorylase [Phenylobacterium sp. J367]